MRSPASTATVRVGTVSTLLDILDSFSVDTSALLSEVGMTRSTFEDEEALLPYAAVAELLGRGEALSGCEHLGLLVGMANQNTGLPGFMMLHAPSIRTGLEAFTAILSCVDSGGVAQVKETAGAAILSYSVVAPDVRHVDVACDLAIAKGYGLLKRACGGSFKATEIRLPKRQPTNLTPYRSYYMGERVKFDSHEACIEFPASYLDAPVKDANPDLFRFLRHVSEREASMPDGSLAAQVRRMLPGLVRHGGVNSDALAQMFGMHPRTFARRLASENVTLHALVEDARLTVAQQLLKDTDLRVTEIATSLYYSEISVFTRAFGRKVGMSPSEWRKLQTGATATPARRPPRRVAIRSTGGAARESI